VEPVGIEPTTSAASSTPFSIDRTYVSSLERSVYAAGIDVNDRLARALGIEAADLLKKPASSPKEKTKKIF